MLKVEVTCTYQLNETLYFQQMSQCYVTRLISIHHEKKPDIYSKKHQSKTIHLAQLWKFHFSCWHLQSSPAVTLTVFALLPNWKRSMAWKLVLLTVGHTLTTYKCILGTHQTKTKKEGLSLLLATNLPPLPHPQLSPSFCKLCTWALDLSMHMYKLSTTNYAQEKFHYDCT